MCPVDGRHQRTATAMEAQVRDKVLHGEEDPGGLVVEGREEVEEAVRREETGNPGRPELENMGNKWDKDVEVEGEEEEGKEDEEEKEEGEEGHQGAQTENLRCVVINYIEDFAK